MPKTDHFNIDKLPFYIAPSFNHGIKMSAFKKELALLRKLSPLYAFYEGDIDALRRKKSRFYWAFLMIADWFRVFFNLEVKPTHPEFVELGMRLAHMIHHPINASKKMTNVKALLACFYPCFFVQESVKTLEPKETAVSKPSGNKPVGAYMSTTELPAPSPVKSLPTYACSFNERREEAKKTERILQAAMLLDEADKETASRHQYNKSADTLQKKSLDNCKRFIRHGVLSGQDAVHLSSKFEDLFMEAQTIFSLTQDDVQSILLSFMEDKAFVKVNHLLSRHLPRGVTSTFFFQPELDEVRTEDATLKYLSYSYTH